MSGRCKTKWCGMGIFFLGWVGRLCFQTASCCKRPSEKCGGVVRS
ncbi:hypothetical protein NEIELOOT_01562 [Neisseria elongata subsp. glycolytica ATCC 29315]|uniref:Uncharacterized protein n=1 Tax=Neisseria elongata subsp. glycolytica ATCC 29315 TaxID=546263 RepID=D4DR70_NEIEG|nr:hypothetical protein NEIELOOT_01562 [Neisseria elongata subsp. glycolytica ATCC 29315]